MPSKSKAKGNTYEREVVEAAEKSGLKAVRAWGSNGKALGEDETVDLIIAGYKVQAKRRKVIASYAKIPEACDVVVMRGDRESSLVVIPLERWFELIKLERKKT